MAGESQNGSAVTVYTDGGCKPNPGAGGWAAVLLYNDTEKELYGAEPDTTNNRMELTAAIEALQALKRPCSVVMHTDSEYVKRGITEWMPGWKRAGWKRKTGAIKNSDLWRKLDELASQHDIDWRWVKGHAGDYYNERCDELATQAIEEMRATRSR